MAAVQLDTLQGGLALAKSAFEELRLILYDAIVPLLKRFTESLTKLIKKVSDWANAHKPLIAALMKTTTYLAPILLGLGGLLILAPQIQAAFALMAGAKGIGALVSGMSAAVKAVLVLKAALIAAGVIMIAKVVKAVLEWKGALLEAEEAEKAVWTKADEMHRKTGEAIEELTKKQDKLTDAEKAALEKAKTGHAEIARLRKDEMFTMDEYREKLLALRKLIMGVKGPVAGREAAAAAEAAKVPRATKVRIAAEEHAAQALTDAAGAMRNAVLDLGVIRQLLKTAQLQAVPIFAERLVDTLRGQLARLEEAQRVLGPELAGKMLGVDISEMMAGIGDVLAVLGDITAQAGGAATGGMDLPSAVAALSEVTTALSTTNEMAQAMVKAVAPKPVEEVAQQAEEAETTQGKILTATEGIKTNTDSLEDMATELEKLEDIDSGLTRRDKQFSLALKNLTAMMRSMPHAQEGLITTGMGPVMMHPREMALPLDRLPEMLRAAGGGRGGEATMNVYTSLDEKERFRKFKRMLKRDEFVAART